MLKIASEYQLKLFHTYNLTKNMCSNSNQEVLTELFLSAIKSVQPQNLIENTIQLNDGHLSVRGDTYELRKPCYLVGFGKAVLGMALEIESILGSHLQRGVVSVPKGIFECCENMQPQTDSKITYIEGAEHNLPDEDAMNAAVQIKSLVENLEEDDTVLVLMSGGGSALLPLPKEPITLSEKLGLIVKLGKAGADIMELNCIRKQLSELKGGGLAKICFPARVIALIISDIVGDPIDFIASGPTCVNVDTAESAISMLKKYSLYSDIPKSITSVLEANIKSAMPLECGTQSVLEEKIKVQSGKYVHVHNYIIGNNELAVQTVLDGARDMGFQSVILSTKIMGDVGELSRIYASIACRLASCVDESNKDCLLRYLTSLKSILNLRDDCVEEMYSFDFSNRTCLILGGEPTVLVTGTGKGGRNQQLALAFAVELNKLNVDLADISFLSCGTDGIDGPTDAAGAIASSNLVHDCLHGHQLEPQRYLENNDSYTFFSNYNNGSSLIKTGHTGTNVMDIHIIIASPKKKTCDMKCRLHVDINF